MLTANYKYFVSQRAIIDRFGLAARESLFAKDIERKDHEFHKILLIIHGNEEFLVNV